MPSSPRLRRRFSLSELLMSKTIERRDPEQYRQLVKKHYNGPAGWFTLITGVMTGHELLARRVINPKAFDVRGCKAILDVGCGNGRYLRLLEKQADPGALVVGCDFSAGMLRRARLRLRSPRTQLLTADLNRLPFANASFDAVVCGWVLEHLRDPLVGLSELARVTRPGGRLLLLTTEHSLLGAMCSWFYHNRMSTRSELRDIATRAGLEWYRERWWTRLHKLLRAGGIVVELRRAQS